MTIGWFCEGVYTRNSICADGGANHRIPLMAEFLTRGHDIVFYSNKFSKHYELEYKEMREDEKLVRELLSFDITKYKKISEYVSHAYSDIRNGFIDYKKLDVLNLTPIDIFYIEPNSMFLGLLEQAVLIRQLLNINPNMRIVYHDIDNNLNAFIKNMKLMKVDLDKIKFVMMYSNINKLDINWVTSFFPYNEEDEQEILPLDEKEYDLMYIGNDYKRRDKMLKFYNTTNLDVAIYGKYDEFKYLFKDKNIFKGRLEFSKVMNEYRKSVACINIIRQDYEKLGNLTYRTVELAQAGILQVIDADIVNSDRFFGPSFTVRSINDFIKIYNSLDNNMYKLLVEAQRKRIKEVVPSIKDFCNIILST